MRQQLPKQSLLDNAEKYTVDLFLFLDVFCLFDFLVP